MIKSLTKIINATILQNSKRLRTFSRPQQNQIIQIDPKIFEEYSLLTLIRFQQAFQKLSQNNKKQQLHIKLQKLCHLQISNNQGSLILQSNSELSTLFFTSPISGTYKYYFNISQKRFYSNKDGHLLDENVSRQTLKYFGDVLQL